MNMIEQIQQACALGVGASELRRMVESVDGGVIWNVMSGQVHGDVEGRPIVVSMYGTWNHGALQKYYESRATVGSVIEHNGKRWEVIVNRSVRGDAHMPSTNHFVAVEWSEK
jgi:hypothetical protein